MVSLLKDNCMLFPPCLWPKKDIVKIFVGSFFGAYYTKLEDNGLDKKVHLSFIYFYQNILFCKQYQLYMPTQLNLCSIINYDVSCNIYELHAKYQSSILACILLKHCSLFSCALNNQRHPKIYLSQKPHNGVHVNAHITVHVQ